MREALSDGQGEINRMVFYYVYVLLCKNLRSSEFYIGYCKNLKLRLKRHKRREVKSTKGFGKISLIYFEGCLNKTDARKREIQLKTGFGRGYIKRRLAQYLKSKRD